MNTPAYYVCRPHDPSQALGPGVGIKRCAECRTVVNVHQPTLNERLEMCARLGREVVIVCDTCALTVGMEGTVVVTLLPSEDEIEEANP